MNVLLPIMECPAEHWAAIRGIFMDIDDTITTESRLTSDVFLAIEKLTAAGLSVVPITGRPAGWCDMIVRMWPVDAVIGENGAFYFRYDRAQRRMMRRFADLDGVRTANKQRLQDIADEVLAHVPGAAIAADQAYRETDLAIDHCEDVDPLGANAVQDIVRIFEAHGATAKVSSIHVNGWFGDYDKLTMTCLLMEEVFGVDLREERSHYVYVGDSPNDASMFAFFPQAVGVANVRSFADQCEALPRWITDKPFGAGFVEACDLILAAKPAVESA